ncbi:brain protein I3-like [Tribolium madens]|uniref:brain protein I3-like n=1 Tax=Tribolium madens TaxID=41895 RepID=UPI001CF743E1|nr:brain protein I3-like [Tribolium madens]
MEKHQPPPPYYEQPQPFSSPPQAPYNPQPAVTAAPASTHVTNVHVSTQPAMGGTCPICHAGKFTGSFTLCGWLCCLFCFPCGIICCLCMRKKKCSHCGFSPS